MKPKSDFSCSPGPPAAKLRYHNCMKRHGLRRLCRLRKKAVLPLSESLPLLRKKQSCLPFKTIGLASVARSALSLYHQIVTSEARNGALTEESSNTSPRYWMRNREDGPRRADVTVVSLGGCRHTG